jgi:hypothetical protein
MIPLPRREERRSEERTPDAAPREELPRSPSPPRRTSLPRRTPLRRGAGTERRSTRQTSKKPFLPGRSENYKSRGENLIAGFLKEAGIKFLYEYPIIIIDDDDKIRMWYPDFWLPQLNIVIEYFGMMNDEQYREQVKKKQTLYQRLDIDFIGLDTSMVQLHKNWEKFIIMRIMEIMDSKRPLYRR